MAHSGKFPILTKIIVDNKPIEQVPHFDYLGCNITYDAVIDIQSISTSQCLNRLSIRKYTIINNLSLPSKETLRGHSDSSFRGEDYIQCCVGVRLCDMYSNQELAEIHFMYGKADGNAALARRLYQERYPQRQCPDRKTFVHLHYRLCEYGKFNSPGLGRRRPRSTTPEVQEEIYGAGVHILPGKHHTSCFRRHSTDQSSTHSLLA
ncbi:hypothetical protein ANN_26461 [Periplaneta americana]|uniref:DUF4817 domain-containing protein n=1 Tax=Periplaneta americana TaxID=6978 RepID=A0ABQ8RYB5_PERAM|nr:hypothetical protein ANN_26461 [Periplaneta americana]